MGHFIGEFEHSHCLSVSVRLLFIFREWELTFKKRNTIVSELNIKKIISFFRTYIVFFLLTFRMNIINDSNFLEWERMKKLLWIFIMSNEQYREGKREEKKNTTYQKWDEAKWALRMNFFKKIIIHCVLRFVDSCTFPVSAHYQFLCQVTPLEIEV